MGPQIAIGMTLYNNAKYLPKAIESLLAQTYGDFRLVIVDDCSTDGSEEIARSYAAIDKRVIYCKNETRQGMILMWRRVFCESNKEGDLDYFAWAGDHDMWKPEWLKEHVEVLNKHPEVVMVYPLTVSIDNADKVLPIEPTHFETFGMGKSERIRMACLNMVGAGNMIYGLFRAGALAKCGVFPWSMMPDRLLLLEMLVQGTYKQIQKELWYRRHFNPKSEYAHEMARQKIILFPDKKAPWHSSFPTLSHAMLLIYHLSLRPPSGSYANAHLGPYIAYMHLHRKKRFLMKEFKVFVRNTKFLS